MGFPRGLVYACVVRAAANAELSRACMRVCDNPPAHAMRVQVSQHRRCRVRMTISKEAGEAGGEGHRVMLAAVMVTHKVPTQD